METLKWKLKSNDNVYNYSISAKDDDGCGLGSNTL